MSVLQSTTNPAPTHKPHPRAKFTKPEDFMLTKYVTEYGENNWELISKLMQNRNARQCKERWCNYLSPNVSKSPWTPEEDALLEQKYSELGPKWVNISKFFVNRTDTMLKNRFLVLTRRANKQGINKTEKIAHSETKQAKNESVPVNMPNIDTHVIMPPTQVKENEAVQPILVPKSNDPPAVPPPPINTPVILKRTQTPIPPKFSYKHRIIEECIQNHA